MLSRRLAAAAPAWGAAVGVRGLAGEVAATAGGGGKEVAPVTEDDITIKYPGQAFVGDLRSTSALSVGERRWRVCVRGRGEGGGVGLAPSVPRSPAHPSQVTASRRTPASGSRATTRAQWSTSR